MLSKPRKAGLWNTAVFLRRSIGWFALTAVVSGCSTDVVRLNAPTLNLGAAQENQVQQPKFAESSLFDQTQNSAAAPAASLSFAPNTAAYEPAEKSRIAQAAPSETNDTSPSATPSQVIVQSGDTLYTLARRYNISVEEIKRANGLTSNIIRRGQTLNLSSAGTTMGYAQRQQSPQTSSPSYYAESTHTVQRSETLYSIARRTGVSVSELQRLNGINDPRKLRTGQVLRLTKASGQVNLASAQSPNNPASEISSNGINPASTNTPIILNPGQNSRIVEQPAARISQTGSNTRIALNQPVKRNSPKKVEKIEENTALNFRWPVNGRIIRNFGRRADGTNNDGINIAVPIGTDVKAAEKGVVAYAGSELKGYGNLILVRHADGYVSVYAHVDSILIRRGDNVRRGQTIAKAGKSGSAQQPQLHFELRQGAKPIDPMPYLGRM